MKNKITSVMTAIFSIGLSLCMLAAFGAFLAFVAAFILGGDGAATVCAFLRRVYLPGIYILGTAISFVGIIKMYLDGEKSFVLTVKGKE